MEVPNNPTFDEQRERYSFRFTCDHCVHYDDYQNVCIHGFPNEMHMLEPYESEQKPKTILFCKDFDLR